MEEDPQRHWPALSYGAPKDLLIDLALANRILEQHEVLDTYGHISVRFQAESGQECFLMSEYAAPALVDPMSIQVYKVADGEALNPSTGSKGALERHIHAGMYRKRPDVQSVLHCHAPIFVTFSILRYPPGQGPLPPVLHVAAPQGLESPVFDIREIVGDGTDLLIKNHELGDALADFACRFSSTSSLILMRGHGATLFSTKDVRDLVSKSIYAVENACILRDALLLQSSYSIHAASATRGPPPVETLSPAEIEACGNRVLASDRSWKAWVTQLRPPAWT